MMRYIYPTFTVSGLRGLTTMPRKFSPDGKYLFALSTTFKEICLYRVNGFSHSFRNETDLHDVLYSEKALAFEKYFQHLYTVTVAPENQFLIKDVGFFVKGNKYLIVASSTIQNLLESNERNRRHFRESGDQGDHSDEGQPSATYMRASLMDVPIRESISIHSIRVSDGQIVSSYAFSEDYISLEAGGGGVSIYEDLILLLSLPTQTIYILQMRSDGQLVLLKQVGEFMRDDDLLNVSVQESREARFGGPNKEAPMKRGGETRVRPPNSSFFSCIRQRILAHIFKDKLYNDETSPEIGSRQVLEFFQQFDFFANLVVMRALLLNRTTIFCKLCGPQDTLGIYYAIFDLTSTKIEALCHSSDERLPMAMQAYYDLFRNPSEESRGQYISTISNCPYQLQGITNYSEAVMNSTAGQQTVNSLCPSMVAHGSREIRGQIFAAVHVQRLTKLMAMLPVFPQSLSLSPYFDSRLFHYDERCISSAEKIRQFTGSSVKFLVRRPGKAPTLAFRIDATQGATGPATSMKISGQYYTQKIRRIEQNAGTESSRSRSNAGNGETGRSVSSLDAESDSRAGSSPRDDLVAQGGPLLSSNNVENIRRSTQNRSVQYIFHPYLPLVLTLHDSTISPPIVNIHFRWIGA